MNEPPLRPDGVRSFERGLAVISCFTGAPLTLSEVADRTGMSPAAARRYLITLADLGYLSSRDGKFAAEARLVELAAPFYTAHDHTARVQVALGALSAATGETSSFTQLHGHKVINVLTTPSRHELAIQVDLGRHLPAHTTAMGRAMLATLSDELVDEILDQGTPFTAYTPHTLTDRAAILEQIRTARSLGYAFVEDEFTVGIRTLSMAFQLPNGDIGAISAPTPTARETREGYINRVEPALRAAIASMGLS